jgi:hypothetical protein
MAVSLFAFFFSDGKKVYRVKNIEKVFVLKHNRIIANHKFIRVSGKITNHQPIAHEPNQNLVIYLFIYLSRGLKKQIVANNLFAKLYYIVKKILKRIIQKPSNHRLD